MNRVFVDRKRLGGVDRVILANDRLRLVAAPELGGKITSLIRLESGYEFLLQREPNRQYQRPAYGQNFERGDLSGFDECLPTVAPCMYPEEPFFARQLPDHGDVWSLPSTLESAEGQVRFVTSLASLPLRFAKSLQLQGGRVRFDYEVTNLSQSVVKCLWSAHPLLRVQPNAEIVLPQEVNEVEVSWSKGERLGKPGVRYSWPKAREKSGQIIDLSRVASPAAGTADKLFTSPLSQGFCGLFLPKENEHISFHFDPKLIPYLGIWICQGGWPDSGAKQFTVALEPCTGRPDSLELAAKRKECSVLDGYDSKRWWMEIEVGPGAPRSF